jgi:hypothetical protein
MKIGEGNEVTELHARIGLMEKVSIVSHSSLVNIYETYFTMIID